MVMVAAHAIFEVGEVEALEGFRQHGFIRPDGKLDVFVHRVAVDAVGEVARRRLLPGLILVAIDRAAQQCLAGRQWELLIELHRFRHDRQRVVGEDAVIDPGLAQVLRQVCRLGCELDILAHAPAPAGMWIVAGKGPRHAVDERLVEIGRAIEVLQRRVRHGDVIAFIVDVAHRLPVDRRLLGPDAPARHHVGDVVVRHLGLDRLQELRHRRLRAAFAEADEDETHPDFEVERHQAELGLVEVGEGAWAGSAAQCAVEIVDPAVERADKRVLAGALAVGDDAAAAVAAHIVESAHHAVLAAHDERALADDVHGQIVAGIGHVADVAGDLPVVAKDVFLLELEKGVGVITPPRQTPPVPIVRDRHVTEVRVHGYALLFVEYSFNKSIFRIEMQWLAEIPKIRGDESEAVRARKITENPGLNRGSKTAILVLETRLRRG